jgi:glycerophosphoryl diester phosphodiesterase
LEIVVLGKSRCIIERKPSDAAAGPLCELIGRLGITEQVVITSYAAEPNAWDFLNQCLDTLPRVQVAYQIAGDFFPSLETARAGQIVDCQHEMLSPELVAEFRRRGLRVFAWTANDEADFLRLDRMGVEGITTDDPAWAIQVLSKPNRD